MSEKRKIPNWYVVTGAPSSGISTLVKALKPYVDKTFPVAARSLIDSNLKKGIPVSETRKNEKEFQIKVNEMKLKREARADKSKTYVFERGVPDSIAYFSVTGLDPKPIKKYSRNRYKLVFFLEPLDSYTKDYARTESAAVRDKLNKLIFKAYKDLGYKVIRIPAVSIEERVRIVLDAIKSNK